MLLSLCCVQCVADNMLCTVLLSCSINVAVNMFSTMLLQICCSQCVAVTILCTMLLSICCVQCCCKCVVHNVLLSLYDAVPPLLGTDPLDMEAMLTSPSGKQELCEIKDLDHSLYHIRFKPSEEGVHTVSLKHKGLHISGRVDQAVYILAISTRTTPSVCSHTHSYNCHLLAASVIGLIHLRPFLISS